jgi:adenosylcobinamide kinase/adenosylcobinamide-phosphate guanylyltransferase
MSDFSASAPSASTTGCRVVLLLGGARSGKSSTAERMAQAIGGQAVLYVATAQAFDDEMRARVARHRAERPAGWQTLEAPTNVAAALGAALQAVDGQPGMPSVVLLDCITLLATNALLSLPDAENAYQADANRIVLAETEALLALRARRPPTETWIIVTNEVGMGIVPAYRLGRIFRDALGIANQRIASAADEVHLLVAGLPWRLK